MGSRFILISLAAAGLSACVDFEELKRACLDAGTCADPMMLEPELDAGQDAGSIVEEEDPEGTLGVVRQPLELRVAVNDTASRSVRVTNLGAAPMTVSLEVDAGASGFALRRGSCGQAIERAEDCQAVLEVTGGQPGEVSSELIITGTDADGGRLGQARRLARATVVERWSLAPGEARVLDFMQTSVGQQGASRAVTLEHAAQTETRFSFSLDGDGGFEVGPECLVVDAGAPSCTFSVRFTPRQSGLFDQQLTIRDQTRSEVVRVQAQAVTPAAVRFEPSSLDFGAVDAGDRRALPFTVRNVGQSPASFGLTLTGPRFAFDAGSCGASLSGGAACEGSLVFWPSDAGAQTGQLKVWLSADGGASFLNATGVGRALRRLNTSALPAGAGSLVPERGQYWQEQAPLSVTVSAFANPDASFYDVGTFSQDCAGAASSCTVTMDRDRSVTHTFSRTREPVTTAVVPHRSGTVRVTPSGPDCGLNCTAVPRGSHTLTATALSGYSPASITCTPAAACGLCAATSRGSLNCTLTVGDGGVSVTATFQSNTCSAVGEPCAAGDCCPGLCCRKQIGGSVCTSGTLGLICLQ